MAATHYNADEVTISFSGISLEEGLDDGEFVNIEQGEDSYGTKVGSDGSVTRFKVNNPVTQVTITLMQTSSANLVLSALHNLDLKAGDAAGIAPLLIKDRLGNSIFAAAEAWIMKPPDVSYDREPTGREWVFECAQPERIDGGN